MLSICGGGGIIATFFFGAQQYPHTMLYVGVYLITGYSFCVPKSGTGYNNHTFSLKEECNFTKVSLRYIESFFPSIPDHLAKAVKQ